MITFPMIFLLLIAVGCGLLVTPLSEGRLGAGLPLAKGQTYRPRRRLTAPSAAKEDADGDSGADS